MNLIIISGRLTRDVETSYYTNKKGSQSARAKFTVAVDDYANGDKKTYFMNCTMFGFQAENMERYTSKGLRVLAEGKLVCDKVEKDGKTNTYYSILVERLEYIDFKDKNGKNEAITAEDDAPSGFSAMDTLDIPF